FYGWSLSGNRSLAEFFYNNLIGGRQMNGFTDVKFCPLLANHLADTLLLMLGRELSGLYHVVGPECLSKYEFGRRIAARFGFNPDLVSPVTVAEAGLKAPRSPNLTLRVGKLTRDLGEPLPGIDAGIEQLFELYQQGYPKKLKALQITNN
ncbi:MAG: sugar nucleotide-binding protein, partial [Anaerolineae bacterium]|nr:sugar nucleotide-binding protein [Anaerolineae bacterium]